MSSTETPTKKPEYYAWTAIQIGAEIDKDSKTIMSREFIKVGDKVTVSDLPGGQKEFDHFVQIGIIRDTPMPHTRLDQSPKQAVMAQAREQIESINKGVGRKTSKG